MGEWPLVRLGDVAQVVDCEHKTAPLAEIGSEYGYSVGTPHIQDGRIDYATAKRVTSKVYEAWSRRAVLCGGDLILAREAPVGQVGRVDPVMPTCLGQRTVLVRSTPDQINERYLHAYLLGRDAQAWMTDRSSGSTVAHLNVADVREIPVAVPPLDEQRRIAAVLGALDDLIETNRQFMQQVRNLSSSLYARLVADSDDEVLLREVASISARKVKLGSGMLRYIDIAAMRDGRLDVPDPICWESAPSRARLGVENGSTLWSTVRPNRRAHALVVEASTDLVASTGIAVLTPDSIGPAELFAASDRDDFVDQLVAMADGSAYPAVRPAAFGNVVIPRLAAAVSAEFEHVMWALWRDAHAASVDNERLTRTRDELLPLLMSGRVQVRPEDVSGARQTGSITNQEGEQ
jgi:type I restriction enzyme S subunit